MAKKKAKPSVGKASRRPARALPAKKPSLYYPQPNEIAGRVRVEPPKIPPHSTPLDIQPVPSLSRINEPRKKPLRDAALAVVCAALVAGAMAAFFIHVIMQDELFALCLAFPFFVGLTILFFNFLELSARTGAQ